MHPVCNLLAKFANSFDIKDWQGLEDTLADNIECNYQDLRGEIKTYAKKDYVDSRKAALAHLHTQHLFSNLEIDCQGNEAYCRLSALIYRKDKKGKQFNSHVIYNFVLVNKTQGNNWKISKIKQAVLWNEGESVIHKGLR
ncbi:nuclear transport factor 2 family protein [Legionella sp. CNM-1927-20]|uniref:nuclear transport factor 2 family protein n=1 Tax=Legionella sp. CNM-1927-20 TaxID=3422221 RepID=UPI00403A9A1B